MAVYIVVDIEITDPQQYEAYKRLTPATIAAHGGKYLARGGKTITLEGGWQPQRLVVLEFENMERVNEWWNSPEFAALKEMRLQSARASFVAIEGVSAQP